MGTLAAPGPPVRPSAPIRPARATLAHSEAPPAGSPAAHEACSREPPCILQGGRGTAATTTTPQ
eukprot:5485820-Pyramimonas_sp.AAC.1